MEIAYSNTLTDIPPDTFITFPGGGDVLPGPGTLVWIVYSGIDADQSLRVNVYGRSDNGQTYGAEDVTVTADESNLTGFQSTPVPLVDEFWGTLVGVRIVGGTLNHDVNVVAIRL